MMASRLCYWLTEIGLKSIYICPDLNYGAAVHADKWIPILPNTDAALQLAIAYVWITEGTYDKEYIATHSYGFDKFEDYVLGKEDGVPKTPAWASGEVRRPRVDHQGPGQGLGEQDDQHHPRQRRARHPRAVLHEPARLEAMLLGMQGLGKPGVHQAKMIEWWIWSECYPLPYQGKVQASARHISRSGPSRRRYGPQRDDAAAYYSGNHPEMLELTKTRGQSSHSVHPQVPDSRRHPQSARQLVGPAFASADRRRSSSSKHTFPVEGCSEIHMIWTDSPCWITCWNDSNTFIQALQKPSIECIVAQHPWLENDCLLADIILPVSTRFEMMDIGNDLGSGTFVSLFLEEHCIDPVGESLCDFDIVAKIAEKLGLREEYTRGKTIEEKQKLSFEASGVDGLISWEELQEEAVLCHPLRSRGEGRAARAE